MELKRKSALLVKVLRLEHWDFYARNLIKDLLINYNKKKK